MHIPYSPRRLAVVMAFLLIACVIAVPCEAQQVLESLHESLKVKLHTYLSGESSKPGDSFEATLPDRVVFESYNIPSGTRFYGHVEDARKSKRFGRTGYIVLTVDRVVFPDGNELQFYFGELSAGKKKLYDESERKARAKGKKYRYAKLPLTVISFVTPLPVTLAVKGATGAALGATDKAEPDAQGNEESRWKRMGRGMYKMSPIPGIKKFVKKQPTPVYHPGDTIYLYLPEEALTRIMSIPTPDADSDPR